MNGLRTSAGVRRDFARMLRAADPRDTVEAAGLLPSFDKPALVVWAADDKFFPREHGERLAELLPQGRFELVKNSRTFIPEDNPQALVAAAARRLGLCRRFRPRDPVRTGAPVRRR